MANSAFGNQGSGAPSSLVPYKTGLMTPQNFQASQSARSLFGGGQTQAPPPLPVHTGLLAPKAQPTSHTVTTGADGTTTTKQTFAQPQTGDTTPSAPPTPQQGTPAYYANQVQENSQLNNNPQYQALASQNNLLTQAQNNVSTAGTAGSTNTINQTGTDSLGNKYSDLFRPQSTANLTGEKGILNPYLVNAEAGNTAEANRLLSGSTLATTGATTNLNASLPQSYSYGTNVINPITGQQFGAGAAGQGGAFSGGLQQGNQSLGQEFSQKILPAYNQAGTIKDSFQTFLSQNPNINPSSLNIVNTAQQWLNGKQLSDPNQAKLGQFLTEFTNTLAPIVGSTGDVTNFKQELVNQLINSTASGQSLSQAIDSLYALASGKVQDIYKTGTGGGYVPSTSNTSGGSTGGGQYNF